MVRHNRSRLIWGLVAIGLIIVGGLSWWLIAAHSNPSQRAISKQTQQRRQPKLKSSAFSSDDRQTQRAAQSKRPPKNRENANITAYLKAGHFVGSALVVRNNRVVYRKGFGYADYEAAKRNTPASEYQILSIQKSLTAAMVMKLIMAGKLSLKTRLSRFYAGIPNARNIRIRNLLDMDSGLSMAELGPSAVFNEHSVVHYDVQHLTSRASQLGQWSYQPVNYVLLAGIIAKLTHESYGRYFDQTFVKPLGLKSTGFVQHWGRRPNRTLGYRYLSANQVRQTYGKRFREQRTAMYNELGTGQVYMSTADLYRTERAILLGKIVLQAAVTTLHTPGTVSTYGGGVYNLSNGIRSHGIGYGFESVIFMTNNGRSGVVLLSNNYRPAATIQRLAESLFNQVAKS